MPYRMFLFVAVCQNGCNTQPWPVAVTANSVIVSHEPTSRVPCSGLSTVPIMDCAIQSCELPLESFASATE